MKEYINKELQKGYIQKSSSPCSSPIFFVKKADGGLRPCVDYRKLNSITVKNKYPIPSENTLTDKIQGATVYSKIDLKTAFNQLRIEKGHKWKTALL